VYVCVVLHVVLYVGDVACKAKGCQGIMRNYAMIVSIGVGVGIGGRTRILYVALVRLCYMPKPQW
jgi:hypothetical protein